MGRSLDFTVPPELDGRRVRSILQSELGLSAGLVTRLKYRESSVLLNGRPARTIDPVRTGDRLTVEVGDAPGGRTAPMRGALDVVYEDEDILIVNKPAGLATHGRAEREPTLANIVAAYLNSAGFHPVNRLDRGTSGLLCVAKSGYAHERLRRILHSEDFRRGYIALARGRVEPPQGRIALPIMKVAERKFGVREGGAPSATNYEVLAQNERASLLRVRPETGRTHQIRVHFSAIGHPLIGDRLYGGASDLIDRPALHSAEIVLLHPISEKPLRAEAPLPQDMQALISALGLK